MPGDYSRETFNRKKYYSNVRMQQGRVQLDADWNEQGDIQRYRIETEAIDVIGRCGVPLATDGFKIEAAAGGDDLTISPGRIYVDGLLLELDEQSSYTTQPYLPHPEFATSSSPPSGSPPGGDLQLNNGTYLVYLDAWQRERTALDDRELREVALDGPDTTTRLQNVWQVKLLKVAALSSPPASPPASPPNSKPTCKDSFPEFDDLIAASTGKLNARTVPPKDEDNVCLLPPGTGYSGFENQLYRVEVHTGGTRNQATFKFSRNNASFETSITNIKNDVITVSDLGKDEVLSFIIGQWVEIVDDESTLKGTPHPLAQIDNIDQATKEITVKTSVAGFAGLPGLKLRAWDQTGADATASGVQADLANFIDLESGIQVNFSTGLYHSGDYWLIPARTATGDIEWPRDESPSRNPIAQTPKGIQHHFCRLALIEVSGGVITVIDDCRKLFPPLTELIHFFYVGGAGQEAMPGNSLPCPLQVGITNGQFPVPGAHVKFALVGGSAGTLHAGAASGASLTVLTNEKGIAQCTWQLGQVGQGCMQVEANLLGEGGVPFEPPIRFNANFSVASQVAYDPKNCDDLKKAHTVQQAIDLLCKMKPKDDPAIKITKVITMDDQKALVNDTLVPVNRLLKGLTIVCDRAVSPVCFGTVPDDPPSQFSPDSVAGKPTCFMTIDVPYPLTVQESIFWSGNEGRPENFGFHPLVLACRVGVNDKTITCTPSQGAMNWLQGMLFQTLEREQIADRVLAHLTLKGRFIFGGGRDSTRYLDGEAFGVASPRNRVNLKLPSGEGHKGGDFEMWFWLMPPPPPPDVVNLSANVVGGQGIPRGINGSVKVSGGLPAVGTQVTLLGLATGVTKTVVTDPSGNFTFMNIEAGSYRVSVKVGAASAQQTVNVIQ